MHSESTGLWPFSPMETALPHSIRLAGTGERLSMLFRELRLEPEVQGQLKHIGLSYRRFDELMEFAYDFLAKHPDAFPVVTRTRISLCLTNEFVGNSFPDIPALAIYFHYDERTVNILSIEASDAESYGLRSE